MDKHNEIAIEWEKKLKKYLMGFVGIFRASLAARPEY